MEINVIMIIIRQQITNMNWLKGQKDDEGQK